MSETAKITVREKDIAASVSGFLQSLLSLPEIGGVFVPMHLSMKNEVMPALVTDPEKLVHAAPFSPAYVVNSARLVSRLTRKPQGKTIAAFLRPCEIRALIELVKLKQARTEELVIIAADCMGAFSTRDYLHYAREGEGPPGKGFVEKVLSGDSDLPFTPACRACIRPVPEYADILIGLHGVDIVNELLVQAKTEKGETFLSQLNLEKMDEPEERKKEIQERIDINKDYKKSLFEKTALETGSLEKLAQYLSACVNCYNCRVACPVCYCRECVFLTEVFNHEPFRYLAWAGQEGALKLPSDTVFYHLTRLAHMSLSCVGCGQCSNACPNDIPLFELFQMVGEGAGETFAYEPGRDPEEPLPLSVFLEKEFPEVVGIH